MKYLAVILILLQFNAAQAVTFFTCTDVDSVATAKISEFVLADKFTLRFLTYLEIDGDVIYKNPIGQFMPAKPVLIDEFSVLAYSGGVHLEHEGQELDLDCQ